MGVIVGSSQSGPLVYICAVRLDRRTQFLLWESNGSDRVLVDADGWVYVFPSETSARQFEGAKSVALSDEPPADLDIDAVDAWCSSGTSTVTAALARAVLDVWNFVRDLPLEKPRDNLFCKRDREANLLYAKLLQSCELPALAERQTARWAAEELQQLMDLIRSAIAELRGRLPKSFQEG